MKRLLIAVSLIALCVTSLVLAETPATKPAQGKPAQSQPTTQPDIFKTQMDKVSYVIGYMSLGANAKRSEIDLNTDMLVQGYKDAMADKGKLTEQQMRETMMAFSQEMQAKMMEKQAKEAETNKKEGEEFLAKNAKEEGVVTLPSGLQYKVIKEGNGPLPKSTDTVNVRYTGTLVDGTQFDTSGETTRPFQLPSGVISGMSEALQKMPIGSQWKLFIPSNLAYGPQRRGPQIPANATLIFDVELVSIQPPATQPAGSQPAMQMPRPAPSSPTIQLRPTPTTQPAAH